MPERLVKSLALLKRRWWVSNLHFDAATHTYSVDGVIVPSVTQVLEDVGIVDYSGIPEPIREAALERGRLVHLCTQYDEELEREGQRLADSEIDPALSGFVEAARRFRRETGFAPNLIEHRGFHRGYRYAGTLDRTGTFRGSTMNDIVDYKTGTAAEWVKYQTAAYAAFFERPRMMRRLCVELHADGTYTIPFVCEGREFQEHFNVFLSALNVFRVKHPNGKRQERRAA